MSVHSRYARCKAHKTLNEGRERKTMLLNILKLATSGKNKSVHFGGFSPCACAVISSVFYVTFYLAAVGWMISIVQWLYHLHVVVLKAHLATNDLEMPKLS